MNILVGAIVLEGVVRGQLSGGGNCPGGQLSLGGNFLGGNCLGANHPRSSCPGGNCLGAVVQGVMVPGAIVLGAIDPGEICRGELSGGHLSGGNCPRLGSSSSIHSVPWSKCHLYVHRTGLGRVRALCSKKSRNTHCNDLAAALQAE